jgi:predicted  nucleic acid-binding Zn-ribbon protein
MKSKLLTVISLLGAGSLTIQPSESRPGLPTLKTSNGESLHEPLAEGGFKVPDMVGQQVSVVLTSELTALDESAASLQEQNDQLNGKIAEMTSNLGNLVPKVDLETANADKQRITEDRDRISGELSSLQTKYSEMEMKLKSMESNGDPAVEIKRLNELLATTTSQRDELQKKVNLLENG